MNGATPLLVNTQHKSFQQYINSLSKTGRKNYRYVKKHNQDLHYKRVDFHKPQVEQFMFLWSQQTIHGNESVTWAFDIGFVKGLDEKGVLRVFEASNDEVIALHFVEQYDEYVYCHPPMYDKKHNKRYVGKYMWFSLINYAIIHDINWIDLGSGDRGTWRDLVMNRHSYPRIKYKWLYVPEKVKNEPQKEKPYLVYDYNGFKRLECQTLSKT